MRVDDVSRRSIEQKIEGMSDYVRMEYLRNCLKVASDFETKKFVLIKLAGVYEGKGMFLEAGKMMKSAAEINVNVSMKIADYLKSVELFVRGGDYDSAEALVKKAISTATSDKKKELGNKVYDIYQIQAKVCVNNNRRKQAIEIYERLLGLRLGEEPRKAQEQLANLYHETGDYNKYKNLKKKFE